MNDNNDNNDGMWPAILIVFDNEKAYVKAEHIANLVEQVDGVTVLYGAHQALGKMLNLSMETKSLESFVEGKKEEAYAQIGVAAGKAGFMRETTYDYFPNFASHTIILANLFKRDDRWAWMGKIKDLLLSKKDKGGA